MSVPDDNVWEGQPSEGVKFALTDEPKKPTTTEATPQKPTTVAQPNHTTAGKKIPVTFAEMIADDGVEKVKPSKTSLARAKSARVSEAFQNLGVRRRLTQLRGQRPAITSTAATVGHDVSTSPPTKTIPSAENEQTTATPTTKTRNFAGRTLSLRLPAKKGSIPAQPKAVERQPQQGEVRFDGAQSTPGRAQALKRALSRGPPSRQKAPRPAQVVEDKGTSVKWRFWKK